jgi:KaiC/GvpD/RAD55 family RecA-like ATPase
MVKAIRDMDHCWDGDDPESNNEVSYRRGYQQGAWAAVQSILSGAEWPNVQHWIELRLCDWRVKGHLELIRTGHLRRVLPATTSLEDMFILLSPANLAALPEPTWLIDGVLPGHAFCVLYGEPGSGKTLVALSIALSVAADHYWCGKRTVGGMVLYVAAEGLYGLKLRVEAYQKKHDLRAENIRYLGEAFSLLNSEHVETLLAKLQTEGIQPDLIVLDTLARLMVGADENSAKEMGQAIAGIDRLRQETLATVLVIHHTRKTGGIERGSSALRGAADVMIECSLAETAGVVQFKCDKMKDAEQFEPINLKLDRVSVGNGRTSLAIRGWEEWIEGGVIRKSAEEALEVLIQKFGREGATNGEWQKAFHDATGKEKSTFDRALRELKAAGRVTQTGSKYRAATSDGGVSVKEVSPRCHDNNGGGSVMSPPFLGGDTDTPP